LEKKENEMQAIQENWASKNEEMIRIMKEHNTNLYKIYQSVISWENM